MHWSYGINLIGMSQFSIYTLKHIFCFRFVDFDENMLVVGLELFLIQSRLLLLCVLGGNASCVLKPETCVVGRYSLDVQVP